MDIQELKSIQKFLGPKTAKLFGLSLLAGILLFVSEIILAYGLQLLLIVTGLTQQKQIDLPWKMNLTGTHTLFLFLLLSGTLRGCLAGAVNALRSACSE